MARFEFRFDPRFRLPALLAGVTPGRAWVDVDEASGRLEARFGPWRVATMLDNVAGVTVTGPFQLWKVMGPAHLSFSDWGLTFGTNADRGTCIEFSRPVRGMDPLGLMRHPGLTVTVAEPDRLAEALRPHTPRR